MAAWDTTRQTTIRQIKTIQYNISQHNNKTRQTISNNIRQYKTRQDNTTQHNIVEAKTRQIKQKSQDNPR